MELTAHLADRVVLEELGRRIARTRLERNLAQADVAAEAGVGIATLQRLERGHSVSSTNLIRVLRALGLFDALDRAIPEPAPSPVSRLELHERRRKRAHRRQAGESGTSDTGPWQWGDDRGTAA